MIAPSAGPDSLLERAEQATESGQTPEAIELYGLILEADPAHDVARNNLGCLLIQLRRFAEAVAVLEERSGPDTPTVLQGNLGYALLNQGELSRAEAVFRTVLDTEPGDGAARNHLGMVLLRRGLIPDATREFQRVVRENPRHREAWNNLGCAHESGGDLQQARAAFREALKVDPFSVDAHNNLGCVLRDLGQLSEGLEELKIAISLEPENPSIHRNLGLTYHRLGDASQARSHLRRYLRYRLEDDHFPEVRRLLEELGHEGSAETTKDDS